MTRACLVAIPLGTLLAAAVAPLPVASDETPRVQFRRGTRHAGLDFRHTSGAFGKKYLPETMGSGCAFLDYDNDGWLDLFLVNSTRFPGRAGGARSTPPSSATPATAVSRT